MKNKSLSLLIVVILLFYSCENKEVSNLKKQISELESKNEILRDSLDNFEENSIIGSMLVGIPELRDYPVNKTGKITFGFVKYDQIRKYNVYEKLRGTEEKKLLFNDLTHSIFKYEFTPKSLDDNIIEIITEFKSSDGSSLIQVPTTLELNVIE